MSEETGTSAPPLTTGEVSCCFDCHLWNDKNLLALVVDGIKPEWWKELSEVMVEMGKPWSSMLSWLLAVNKKEDLEEKSVRVAVERLVKRKLELSRNKQKREIDELLSEEFKFPQKKSTESEFPYSDPTILYQRSLNEHVEQIELLVKNMEESNTQIELLSQVVVEQSGLGNRKAEEIASLRKKLQEIQAQHGLY